jgi:muramidase (phage lysozyme)
MRFASLGGSNAANYAAAGKSVADSAAKMHAVQRKTGPDYGGLSQAAMKTNSAEKIAAINASAKVTKAGISAYSDVTKTGHRVAVFNKNEEIKAKQRKAGGLAAIGKIAGAGFLAATDNTKGRERPKSGLKGLLDEYNSDMAGLKDRQQGEFDALGPYKPTKSGTTTETDSGKVTGGGTDSPSAATTGEGISNGWSRMSNVIKLGEGTQGDRGYTTMFTGAQFTDTSAHPRQINRSGDLASDAAGAFQFLSPTWDNAKSALGLKDFSPASQEKAGKWLAQQRGMDVNKVHTTKESLGRALDKIAPEWASMPTLATGTSYYGQGGLTLDQAWAEYNR